ncbi:DNA helicase MCM9 [Microplitis demolitor]|uniref:DNA helicase MCM9 n=1 Tax=Microplitis demolitor TaxID=69319 RepID=UPI0004CD4823|nr:DNA helicase MCM9 [Microplitis demolitor]
MLKDYLIKHHHNDLKEIINSPDVSAHYSIYVNLATLYVDELELVEKITRQPTKYLPLCDQSAVDVQKLIIDNDNADDDNKIQRVKSKVHIRITGAPWKINDDTEGQLVSITGITVRISQPTMLTKVKRFLCKKCANITTIKLNWETMSYNNNNSTECESCDSKSLTLVNSPDPEDVYDYQEVKIQEKSKTETGSSYSVGMQVLLLDDLINKCKPGDDVEISGVITRRWSPLEEGKRAQHTTIMIANNVSVLRKVIDSDYKQSEVREIFDNYWKIYENDPLVGRNKILASICPQLYGMFTVKLALAIVLAGGVPRLNQTGVRVRGEPHLLMIGDPGTGKSQILRTAGKLATRSVTTTGIGTTAAGLTAAAVKDSDGWHLEAGALVLADKGVCCVDEFSTMSSNDRASMHEAMEQQTISIAKGGLVSTLNTRCSLVAATNPIGGKIVQDEEVKTRIGGPLLSRFDIILHLQDNHNKEWDELTTRHIIDISCEDEKEQTERNLKNPMVLLKSDNLWKNESLREYFAYVHSFDPVISKEADKILSSVFLYLRSNTTDRLEDRTTVRLLDSLIRLAEGHARLMYKKVVDVQDAIVAAQLVGVVPMKMDAGCPFPEDPQAAFEEEADAVLKLLDSDYLTPPKSGL